MKNYSSINSKKLGKLLKRYKLTIKGKVEILKAVKIRSITGPGLNRIARKIEYEWSTTNKNK